MQEQFGFGSSRHQQIWLAAKLHCFAEKNAVRDTLPGKLHTGERYENGSRVMD
jgi:hypothetical protein